MSLPSLLLVIVAGVSAAAAGEKTVTYTTQDIAAYDWIETEVEAGSLVLTDPLHGNRLPAFAHVRVLYGHPFETPDAEFWRAEVLSLLQWSDSEEGGLDLLGEYGVDWVLIELQDATAAPTWLDELSPTERFNGLMFFRNDVR